MASLQHTVRSRNALIARFRRLAAAFAIVATPTAATAADIDLLAPMGDFGVLEAPDPPPGGAPRTYVATGAEPQWNIAQWNIPGGQLPPFVRRDTGNGVVFESRAAEAAVRIARGPAGVQVALSQDGAVLPCLGRTGQPRESDLFIGPYKSGAQPPARPGMIRVGEGNPTLAQMARLMQRVTVAFQGGPAASDKGCAVNQGKAIIAVVLNDHAVRPVQTLFYQLVLGRFCGNGPPMQVRSCNGQPVRPTPFFRKNPFGFDDYLPLAGQPWLRSGERRAIAVDLLPRLAEVIAQGPEGIDRDLSHWVVTSAYGGQHIWGDVALRTEWLDYRLTAVTR